MAGELYTLSDNLLQIGSYDVGTDTWSNGLINNVSGLYINDATVTATVVYKSDRSEVPGFVWPVDVAYVAASDGGYRGTIPYTIETEDRDKLIILITIDGGAGLRQHRECAVSAAIRDCNLVQGVE